MGLYTPNGNNLIFNISKNNSDLRFASQLTELKFNAQISQDQASTWNKSEILKQQVPADFEKLHKTLWAW